MIKMMIFDVDGTLLSHENWQIPVSAVHAIQDLQQQGYKITIASGRPDYALDIVRDAGILPDYVIGCNGHAVYNAKHELIASACFSKHQVEELTRLCKESHSLLAWKFAYSNYVYCGYEEVLAMYRELQISDKFVINCETCDHHEEELPFGAVIYGPQEVFEQYVQDVDSSLVVLPFRKDGMDIAIRKVNKYTGLQQLLETLDIDEKECMAFGDAINDVEILSKVGIAVAMKKCHPALLEVCDEQTDDIFEDGIAKALVKYGFVKEVRG